MAITQRIAQSILAWSCNGLRKRYMDIFFYHANYYSNPSYLVFLVWNVLKMRFPTKCVTYKVWLNTVNFCFIETESRHNFTRSCNWSRAIFLLTSLLVCVNILTLLCIFRDVHHFSLEFSALRWCLLQENEVILHFGALTILSSDLKVHSQSLIHWSFAPPPRYYFSLFLLWWIL